MDRGGRGGFQRAFLLALAGLLLPCNQGTESPSWLTSAVTAAEIEYGRCGAVYLPGPVCELWPEPDRQLRIWVKTDPGAKVEIHAGDRDPVVETAEVRGGRVYTLQIPPQADSLKVSILSPDGKRSPSGPLLLAEPEVFAWEKEIEELQNSGRIEEVQDRLTKLLEAASSKERGLLFRSLAEIARTKGNLEGIEVYLKHGMAADRLVNCLSCEIEKATLLARLYLEEGRFGDARDILAKEPPPESPLESKYRVSFYQGDLAFRVGDYHSALERLRKAVSLAEQGKMSKYRGKAEQLLANVLQDLGRSREASELFARLQKDDRFETPCDKGDLLTNWAWARLLAIEGREKAEDPTPLLEEAQAIYDSHPECTPPDAPLHVRINLALALQQTGHWQEARQVLEQARPLADIGAPRLRLWWQDLEAREAIAEGNPARALQLYRELDENAIRSLSLEGRFRASLGQAHAQLALNNRGAALDAFAEADRQIDEQSRHVPVREGRDTLVARREEATRWYLKLLVDEGRMEDAFALVRRARTRLLRQLMVRERLAQLSAVEQQNWDQALTSYQALRDDIDRETTQEWRLPLDQKEHARAIRQAQLARAQKDLDRAVADLGDPGNHGEGRLAPPRQGEVVLAYHPLPKGWVGFAAHDQEIEVSIFDLPGSQSDPEVLAEKLLMPFRRILERSERVRVLPYGQLRSVDFHTLPFGGEPLLARHLVVYGLDLPNHPEPIQVGGHVALLVADPQGNLPEARKEAAAVGASIRAWKRDWTLKRLDGTAANAKAVRTALPDATLFHYAGHGTFAGFGGWDSVLPLADGTPLTLSDLLALRRAPAWVVLSSCQAGRSSEQAPGEGIGLAHAFLLAGSQAVVAATQDVPDPIARDLMSELYRGWQPGVDLPSQFQRAQLACHRRHPGGECASFRLFEP